MLWGLVDYFVDEVIAVYGSREQAERALGRVLTDEPDWEGMIEVVQLSVPAHCVDWVPKGGPVRRPRCRAPW
jgi:hypothetical protein